MLFTGAPAMAVDVEEMTVLKVCADPYMLPFSSLKEQGFENRIAELFAEKLGVELQYEFFPQRIGFIRNTLKAESEIRRRLQVRPGDERAGQFRTGCGHKSLLHVFLCPGAGKGAGDG